MPTLVVHLLPEGSGKKLTWQAEEKSHTQVCVVASLAIVMPSFSAPLAGASANGQKIDKGKPPEPKGSGGSGFPRRP